MLLSKMQGVFTVVLDLGSHTGQVAKLLSEYITYKYLVQSDLSLQMLRHSKGLRVVASEDALPFKSSAFDLIISAMSLHSVENLASTVKQVHKILRPGGLFLASLFGTNTLNELKKAVAIGSEGDFFVPKVFPFMKVKDAGNLFYASGFKMCIAECEIIKINYDKILNLMHDLRKMGESNAMHEMYQALTTKRMLDRIISCYKGNEATFEIILLTGMKELD